MGGATLRSPATSLVILGVQHNLAAWQRSAEAVVKVAKRVGRSAAQVRRGTFNWRNLKKFQIFELSIAPLNHEVGHLNWKQFVLLEVLLRWAVQQGIAVIPFGAFVSASCHHEIGENELVVLHYGLGP